jgi:hypothetical protein
MTLGPEFRSTGRSPVARRGIAKVASTSREGDDISVFDETSKQGPSSDDGSAGITATNFRRCRYDRQLDGSDQVLENLFVITGNRRCPDARRE